MVAYEAGSGAWAAPVGQVESTSQARAAAATGMVVNVVGPGSRPNSKSFVGGGGGSIETGSWASNLGSGAFVEHPLETPAAARQPAQARPSRAGGWTRRRPLGRLVKSSVDWESAGWVVCRRGTRSEAIAQKTKGAEAATILPAPQGVMIAGGKVAPKVSLSLSNQRALKRAGAPAAQ
ncbi:hypothetical protein PCL_06120 [Purpureocillium lilacinum]|uniref:Uncharacterized protein n=1 Tax=Purpureocillium lilacinum TaxID=33203 RepID=A0A2U3ELV9_PURLI|nr:hypothetical protein Purlil1_10343 [Purpureocillium lilacinum]PWI75462.1 hypothetical protein PCL_06120 [Purpureocillium lilacinum]